MKDLLKTGDYARKQIFSRSGLVRWSHGSRFALARRLVAPRGGGRLLDYGCGDGTLVAMVHDSFREAVGLDVDPRQIDECTARLGALPGVRFALTSTLPDAGSWDVVTCMEVLEHCLEAERRRVIGTLAGLVKRSGVVVVSVPIEVGPSLAGKQFVRAIAGWRRLGDYAHRERYSPLELARSMAGLPVPRAVLEGRGANGPYRYHGHKGFDYRDVAGELAQHFTIARRIYTPVRRFGPLLNSQAWFVCAPL